MNNQKFSQPDNFSDIKRVFGKVVKYWYVFVITLGIAFLGAFLLNRYTPKVYPVSASIILKNDKGGSSAAELLYGSEFFTGSKDLINESIVLKSYPLLKRVVEELGFNKSFYTEGNILTSEVYKEVPATIIIDSADSQIRNNNYTFIILSESTFKFYELRDSQDPKEINVVYQFNKWVSYKGIKFKAIRNSSKNYIGRTFIYRLQNTHNLANSYRYRLDIKPADEKSSILEISINSVLPEKEIDFLGKLIEIYIQKDLEEKNSNATKAIAFIEDQLTSITDSLLLIENQLEDFKGTIQATDISQQASRLFSMMQSLEQERAQVIIQQRYLEYIKEYISSNKEGSDELIIPSSLGVSDPLLNNLIAQLVNFQLERKNLIQNDNMENPYISQLDKKINQLKANTIESINTLMGSTNVLLKDIESRSDRLQQEIAQLPSEEREFINIQRMYDLSENIYIFLTEKKAEAEIAKASSSSNVDIVNPPMLAGRPIAPQTNRNYLIAFFLGFSIPLGFLFVNEYFSTKVRYRDELDTLTNIPFLGVIGHETKDFNMVVSEKPKSAVAESFRSIRSNINFFIPEVKNKVIMISSSISGEGKTFSAINLALVFSMSGKRTLLMGADLRKPKIFDDFNLNNNNGLSNYLANATSLNEIIQPTEFENLHLISAGPIPPNPSELLMNEKMTLLISELRNRYDYIILDTPPMGLVTDALILMNHSDHNIYLVRQNYTPKDTVKNAQEMYESGKLKNLSLLFNDVKVLRYGYNYGYGYGYGSGYYEEGSSNKKSLMKNIFRS